MFCLGESLSLPGCDLVPTRGSAVSQHTGITVQHFKLSLS